MGPGMRRLLIPCLALGCAAEPSGPVGSFELAFGEQDGFVITHPSGLELGTVTAGAFAFREADATFEMQFGSFLIDERIESDWRTSAAIEDVTRKGDRLEATLVDDAGEPLADLVVESAGESLRIAATALGQETRARVNLACDSPDAGGFLGFGAQTHDVDHRGQIVPVFVSEQGIGKVETDEPHDIWFLIGTRHQSYLPVPTMLAPRAGTSYGLHATTFHRSIWDLCKTDPEVLSVQAWENEIELLIAPGPTPLDVVRQQTAHNGRIPPDPPDWTFGVWMDAIGGTDAVSEEARMLREEEIPVSAVWSEDWRGGNEKGKQYVLEEDWGWDRALYPGLPELIDTLHQEGIKFMAYFNTFLVEDADVWDEAMANDYFVQDRRGEPFLFEEADGQRAGLAELFRDEPRAWVRGHLDAALEMGIDGWMADFAEWYPADRRAVTVPTGEDAQVAHHRYPVAWAELNREAIERSGRDDVVVFHRSGYTGSQSKAHVVWAGDQRTSFEADDGLPTIVPILLGLSVTGFPVVTHDIAGYISATNPNTTKELFFRWTTLGALSPVMRTHHGRDAAFNWRWSSDAETVAHFKRWADFHTALFPYWRGLAQEASETGAPILRPLAFADPGDVRLHGVRDAFTVGDALLVAPVVTASTTARRVPLPKGGWYALPSMERFEGPDEVDIDVPLGELGLFARAGAVLPMLPAGVQSLVPTEAVLDLDEVRDRREVWIFLGADGEARDGDGVIHLESPGKVTGEVTVKDGDVLESAEHRLVVRGPTARLEDGAGAAHRISAEGLEGTDLTYIVRW